MKWNSDWLSITHIIFAYLSPVVVKVCAKTYTISVRLKLFQIHYLHPSWDWYLHEIHIPHNLCFKASENIRQALAVQQQTVKQYLHNVGRLDWLHTDASLLPIACESRPGLTTVISTPTKYTFIWLYNSRNEMGKWPRESNPIGCIYVTCVYLNVLWFLIQDFLK